VRGEPDLAVLRALGRVGAGARASITPGGSMSPTVVQTVVFALAPGGGTPGPVVLGGEALTNDAMRGEAERLGAETAFVLPAAHDGCAVRLRYFVPRHEMEMCVHGTVAAVTVLAARGMIAGGALRVETPLGPVAATCEPDDAGLAVTVEQFAPTFGPALDPAGTDAAAVLDALGLTPDALDVAKGPLQAASVSRAKLMVPLQDWGVLDALRPDWEALWAACDRLDVTGFYPFTLRPRAPGRADAEARQFPRRAGYPEDPATGVAAAALGAYLVRHGRLPRAQGADGWAAVRIEQGHAMARPSALTAEVRVGRADRIRTRVRGRATLEDVVQR